MTDRDYGLPEGDEELAGLARVLGLSFNRPPDVIRGRFPLVGDRNLRVLRGARGVEAGLWVIPMGQFFGGRSLPMHGVAAVGVAPEARGAGAAARLMNRLMLDLNEQGIALSGLYPATQTLYRRSGYELAGSRFQIQLRLREMLLPRERGVTVRPLEDEDHDVVKEMYRTAAQGMDGHLDRGEYLWERVFRSPEEPVHGFLAEEGDQPVGYITFSQTSTPAGYDLTVRDLAATTPTGGRRLLSFLADHRSMAQRATLFGGPHLPILLPLGERAYDENLQSYWMTRIVDLKAAFEGRGFPPAARTQIAFELQDDVIPSNNGRFVLSVEDGMGNVEPGGNGKLRLNIRSLAPLYTGFLTPRQLWAMGWLEGDAAEGERAAGVFSGSTPWMPDGY